jgi:hypothetical protein
MDININCQISLSKKLRALIGDNKTAITLISQNLNEGKGVARLMVSLEEINKQEIQDLLNKETSIIIMPIELVEDSVVNTEAVTNIFSSTADLSKDSRYKKRDAISRLAATTPPSKNKSAANLIKTAEEQEQEISTPFSELAPIIKKTQVSQQPLRHISSLEQLMKAIYAAENKSYNVDVDNITNPIKKALAMEAKEKAEAIDYPAYIVACKGNLVINDLNLSLLLNAPFNLANISAKRIANSKQLQALLRDGFLKFIAPEEVDDYLEKIEAEEDKFSLPIYDSHDDILDGIESRPISSAAREKSRSIAAHAQAIELEAEEINDNGAETEQERMSKLVTKPMPESMLEPKITNEATRTTQHGNLVSRPTHPKSNDKNVHPTVRRVGIQIR